MAVSESIENVPAGLSSPNDFLVPQTSKLVGYRPLLEPQFHAKIVDTQLLVHQGGDQAHPVRVGKCPETFLYSAAKRAWGKAQVFEQIREQVSSRGSVESNLPF